jgi:YegS/Rv2252/BmrU family lipid kinase
MRRTLFIINPAAGAGRAGDRWRGIEDDLRRAGVLGDQVVTSRPGEALRLAKEAAPRFDVLVAVGGDGAINEVANGILASGAEGTALGILPLGTGNDFARAIEVSREHEALIALAAGRTRWIDVIEVRCILDGTPGLLHALGFAAVGITGALLQGTTKEVKRVLGSRSAYVAGLLRALWRYQAQSMRVQCDDEAIEDRFLLVSASNCEFAGGGLRLAPGASIEDGLLNVNLIRNAGFSETLGQLRRLRHGEHTKHPKVRYQPARRVAVQTEPPVEVAVDGELFGYTPATFQVKPKALRVVAR